MSDKYSEHMRNYEKAMADYEKCVADLNEVMHEMDSGCSAAEKGRLEKKRATLSAKVTAAGEREKEAKRNLDSYMRSKR